jgi:phthalate 4,5-dioxygenase oxygenase subunit
MLNREDNTLVCEVRPGTPGGDMMRRYWHPICASSQLAVPDAPPLRARLLGETFVVFRDSAGQVGVLEELCMHRGASLALGRVEEGGLRCLYHGWKFGVTGALLETPNHDDPKYRARMKAQAYPVREEGGLVWTYIGPPERQPEFSRFAFMDADPACRVVLRINVACNYLQLVEGGEDTSHVGILHTNMARPGWKEKTFEPNPDVVNPAALATNDPKVRNARVVPFIMPYGRVIPAPAFQFTVFEVPQDDTHTSTYIIVHGNTPVHDTKIIDLLGLDDPRFYDRETLDYKPSWTNKFLQDRELMKTNWTGLRGVEVEDATIGLSQGPLYDRSGEHLVPADMAVVRVRRVLLESVRRVMKNEPPVGVGLDLTGVGACDASLREGEDWRELMPMHRSFVPA